MKFTLFKISLINTDIKFFIVNMYIVNYLARALQTHEALSCTCSYFYVLFMIKEASAVSKRECSDSVFDWLSPSSGVSHLSAQLRHGPNQCIVFKLQFLSFIIHVFQILKKSTKTYEFHLIDYCKVDKYCKVKFIITDTYCYY